jgi:hypothetical protein
MLSRDNVPQDIIDSLNRWRDHGIQPGGFLTAVLRNDLKGAVNRADENNMHIIPDIVFVLYNDYPSAMSGYEEVMRDWPILLRRKQDAEASIKGTK